MGRVAAKLDTTVPPRLPDFMCWRIDLNEMPFLAGCGVFRHIHDISILLGHWAPCGKCTVLNMLSTFLRCKEQKPMAGMEVVPGDH